LRNLASWFWSPSKIGGGLHRNPADLDKLLAKAPDIQTQIMSTCVLTS
jgi:hypothetical protein